MIQGVESVAELTEDNAAGVIIEYSLDELDGEAERGHREASECCAVAFSSSAASTIQRDVSALGSC